MKQSTESAFRPTTRGYNGVKTESCNIKTTRTNHDYALYPMHILNTTWKEKKYVFGMNGQTGKFVGDLPTSPVLFALWTLLFFALIGGVFAVALFFGMDRDALGIVIGLGIGLLSSLFIAFAMKRKNKTAKFRYGSEDYYKPNSMKVSFSRDIFLYKKVTRTPRNTGQGK